MWYDTSLARLLGVRYPIIQAPMASATTAALVAAVSNAGGLGTHGAATTAPDALRKLIREIRTLTERPFGMNLFMPEGLVTPTGNPSRAHELMQAMRDEIGLPQPPLPAPVPFPVDEQMRVIVEEKVPVFSFTFGMLDPKWLSILKRNRIVVIGTATTVREALACEAAGMDAVVAQGYEAGGHRGSFLAPILDSLVGTFALVPQVADAVRIPVIAAGAVMDGRGIGAALTLGAHGVQMGTAFLACPEAQLHALHRNALQAGSDESTTLTRVYTGRWVRAMRNRVTESMGKFEAEFPGYAAHGAITADIRREAAKQNLVNYLPMWAGQAARLARALPAADLVKLLVKETQDALAAHH